MHLDILMVGKIAEKPYRELIDGYLGRCSSRLQVRVLNCRDQGEMEKKLGPGDHSIALDERGRTFDSQGFAGWLRNHLNRGANRISFLLGPAEGLSGKLKSRATETIALSPMTLNHQLAMLVLAEQLYRGISILFGEPYHKP